MNLNEQIEQMRLEQPRCEAKGELILKLQKQGIEKKPMKLITKISIPTAVTAIAIVGGTFMFRPTVMASPTTVANAIREALTYRIKSYNVSGGKRVLMSETDVVKGQKSTKSYDSNGRVIENLPAIDVVKLDGVEGAFGLKLDNAGTIHQLSKADLDKVKSKASGTAKVTAGHLIIVADEKGKQVPLGAERGKIVAGQKLGAKGSVEVKITKDSKGNVTKKYVVDGKEVDKLPAHLQSRVTTMSDKGLADRVRINTGEAIFVEGKKIEIGKEKIDVKGGQVTVRDKVRGGQTVVGMTTKDDKITTFVSGHTSADYLVKILQDGEKWTITRGVTYNGQNFDKFVLKGGFSPIELYVDPATSLPKILRFTPPMADGVTIEDVYEYNIQP